MRKSSFLSILLLILILLIGYISFAQEISKEDKDWKPQRYLRIRIDVAIPESTWNNLTNDQRIGLKNKLIQLKNIGRKINKNKISEEDTVTIKWHWCEHEMPIEIRKPCPTDQDIEILRIK